MLFNFFFLIFINSETIFIFLITFWKYLVDSYWIGTLDSDEQTILVNFYDSLISNGTLDWNIENDLCDQTGVACDSSDPQRVSKLYIFHLQLKYMINYSIQLKYFLEYLPISNWMGQFQHNLGA